MPPSAPPGDSAFELGLVLAGAASAGAYTAGALDFLLQALGQWQKAKDRGADCPQHQVRVKAVAGASAGGMSAAILASLLGEDVPPITSLPERSPSPEVAAQNRLYDCWVRQVSMERFLETRDLRAGKAPHVRSFLDSTVLGEIAQDALRFPPTGGRKRPYIADELHLFLTLTNLRGVPYAIDMRGAPATPGHALSMHADYMRFVLSADPPADGDPAAVWLDPQHPSQEGWRTLRSASLATGAFPGALRPRMLKRPSLDYEQRKWPVLQASGAVALQKIPPQWPDGIDEITSEAGAAEFDYHYLSVDGGALNNEPLELVRRTLARHAEDGRLHNPHTAREVQRPIVMIDPLPGGTPMSREEVEALKRYDIVQTLVRLITSMKMQARFKLSELALAWEEDVYDRFMIAPVRHVRRGDRETHAAHPIASGALGSFGGFFSERFRQHDFQLGRRNCQQFLWKHFTLPLEEARQNPVLAAGDPSTLDRHIVRDQDGAPVTVRGKKLYPMIPLVGTAREEVAPIPWDTLGITRIDLERLREQVTHRTQAVASRLIDAHLGGSISRILAKLAFRVKRGSMIDRVMDRIEADLEDYDLLA